MFIFCETARTHRFSVIFAKVHWHPCTLNSELRHGLSSNSNNSDDDDKSKKIMIVMIIMLLLLVITTAAAAAKTITMMVTMTARMMMRMVINYDDTDNSCNGIGRWAARLFPLKKKERRICSFSA